MHRLRQVKEDIQQLADDLGVQLCYTGAKGASRLEVVVRGGMEHALALHLAYDPPPDCLVEYTYTQPAH